MLTLLAAQVESFVGRGVAGRSARVAGGSGWVGFGAVADPALLTPIADRLGRLGRVVGSALRSR